MGARRNTCSNIVYFSMSVKQTACCWFHICGLTPATDGLVAERRRRYPVMFAVFLLNGF